MARRSLMTWVAESRRWIKKYNGKIYAVSCRQLEVPETKEESVSAANAWWEKKKNEIDAKPLSEDQEQDKARQIWSLVNGWDALDETKRKILVDSLIGDGEYQRLKSQSQITLGHFESGPTPERTVEAQVSLWRNLLQASCQSGQISEGRFDSYSRNIQKFVDWIGPQNGIDQITEASFESFFNHLSKQVSDRLYSPSYAHTLLMTAKQFIARLAELKLIECPRNLRSHRFRFNHSAPNKIDVFSVSEIQALLPAVRKYSEPLELYLLLMLNCGMYQNDIAELRIDEVDWDTGVLTRSRSKTRGRGGPVISYQLWPETFQLLQKYRAKSGELVLLSGNGKPLVRFWLENGRMKRYDLIQSLWARCGKQSKGLSLRLSLKHFRKTSATVLGQHPQYKFYCNHFLADSPKTIADRHYVTPNQAEFFQALDWLRVTLFGMLPSQTHETFA